MLMLETVLTGTRSEEGSIDFYVQCSLAFTVLSLLLNCLVLPTWLGIAVVHRQCSDRISLRRCRVLVTVSSCPSRWRVRTDLTWPPANI